MHSLYTVEALRRIEAQACSAKPSPTLMQRAGTAAFKRILELLPLPQHAQQVLILAGPGDNGGDALEVAAHLVETGVSVRVVFAGDAARLSHDAQAALTRAHGVGIAPFPADDWEAVSQVINSRRWSLVVDGLFGIGLARSLGGVHVQLIEWANAQPVVRLALDVPSGLNADTGCVIGNLAFRATHTVTFIGDKPGLHMGQGIDCAGEVRVADLEIARNVFEASPLQRNQPLLFEHAFKARTRDSHKGDYGRVQIVGGTPGMVGAALLAARTALCCGAGRIYVATPGAGLAVDPVHPELMWRLTGELGVEDSDAVRVVGPGLGQTENAREALERVLDQENALVLDADALNLIAKEPEWQQKIWQRGESCLLTPHPLEAARLLGVSAAEVQMDRLEAARQLARQFNATVILKGAGSIVAALSGEEPDIVRCAINPTGNPGLASGGTGDVLAGLAGALLAQGLPFWEAALAAAWLHGAAADTLVLRGTGPIGLTASELIPAIRDEINALVAQLVGRRA